VALIPVKAFTRAKGRLAPSLDDAGRASLAEAMLRDVIAAAQGCAGVIQVMLLGGGDARQVAADTAVGWLDDGGDSSLNEAVKRAAGQLEASGVDTLLVLPGDLPTLRSADIEALLARHRRGLTLSPARSDGGTNALVISPPDALDFLFGPDSARRHLAGALAAGLPGQRVTLPGFARDIDRPADLHWLRDQSCGDHTTAWLAAHDGVSGDGDAAVGRA
jgi:2-phospho-L-lactate guanylyltransferase